MFKSCKDTKLICNFLHFSLNLDFFLCLHGNSSFTAAFQNKSIQFCGSRRFMFSKTDKMLKHKQRPYKNPNVILKKVVTLKSNSCKQQPDKLSVILFKMLLRK